MLKSLFMTVANINFDQFMIEEMIKLVRKEKNIIGQAQDYPTEKLWTGDDDIVFLRSTLLLGMRGMASYDWHAHVLEKKDGKLMDWLYMGMKSLREEHGVEEWLELLKEFGKINFGCMGLLDEGNTSAYGHPEPTKITSNIEKGPFIIISGHDLLDLKQLLGQTESKGNNIYTHGEMLPAHGYPELKKHPHLKGNFGTAWQNYKNKFDDVLAPILFTTNCLIPPKPSYSDRVFKTSVGHPEIKHILDTEEIILRIFLQSLKKPLILVVTKKIKSLRE